MELTELLLKVLYLGLLYFSVLMVVKPMTSIEGSNLIVIVLSLSVLLMYFTFDKLYDFMTKNKIVIKNKKKDKKKKKKNVEKIEVSQKASSDYMLDHTHKFVKNKVFD